MEEVEDSSKVTSKLIKEGWRRLEKCPLKLKVNEGHSKKPWVHEWDIIITTNPLHNNTYIYIGHKRNLATCFQISIFKITNQLKCMGEKHTPIPPL